MAAMAPGGGTGADEYREQYAPNEALELLRELQEVVMAYNDLTRRSALSDYALLMALDDMEHAEGLAQDPWIKGTQPKLLRSDEALVRFLAAGVHVNRLSPHHTSDVRDALLRLGIRTTYSEENGA